MRLTYIAEDKMIGIDGLFFKIDNTDFDPNIRALQWYDTYGEVEYFDNTPNETIETFDDNYMSVWELSKKKNNQPNTYSIWNGTDWIENNELKVKYENNIKITEAKNYLISTDFKVLQDYDQLDGLEEIKIKRQEARELIRSLEGN